MGYSSPLYPSLSVLAGNGVVPSRHIPAKDRSSGGEDFKAVSRRLEALVPLSFVPNEKLACWFELSGLAQESSMKLSLSVRNQ